ncbi:MAG: hypothetical protein FLDDKLPJ_01945 [Phycisphaerae bacterium]|nr:hypothetical protein [Phycisphaerae bacterium]
MKKRSKKPLRTKPREYDFRRGVRGKYAGRYAEGTNTVLLDPDVAEVFKSGEAVNATLRLLIGISRGAL